MLINQESNNYLPSIQMPLPQIGATTDPLMTLVENQIISHSPTYTNGLTTTSAATTETPAPQENNVILDLDYVDDDGGTGAQQPVVDLNNYNNGFASNEIYDPRIPDSHLTAISQQYPSLTHVPQDIAKSFTPIFVQPQNQQTQGDIYNDYVNNPYNLVLQPQHDGVDAYRPTTPVVITSNFAAVSAAAVSTNPSAAAAATNVFQSSNYFGTTDNSSVVIPPGSEMLFTGP